MSQKTKKSTTKKAAAKRPEPKRRGREGWVIAALVVGLAGVVWWAIPSESSRSGTTPTTSEDGDPSAQGDDAAAKSASDEKRTTIERPPESTAELAVLVTKHVDQVRSSVTASPEGIASVLAPRICGTACDGVRSVLVDPDAFDVDVQTSEEYILPPSDTFDTIAPGLTPAERASIAERTTAIIVRSHTMTNQGHLAYRSVLAAATILAEQLNGLVYDESARRIETAKQLADMAITSGLGEPAFSPKHIGIQLFRDEEGKSRILTQGMARFGAPDLSIRGATVWSASALVKVVLAAAASLAGGATNLPLTVSLDDVAKVTGKKPADLAQKPMASKPVSFSVIDPPRAEGDPDNALIELVPEGGATHEAWDAVLVSLFGETPPFTETTHDKELEEIGKRARRDLPQAIKRFKAGEGELLLKTAFAIPADVRADGGPEREWLWVAIASCDEKACLGSPTVNPILAVDVSLGKTTTVPFDKVDDWLLRGGGKSSGGESIRVLERRAKR